MERNKRGKTKKAQRHNISLQRLIVRMNLSQNFLYVAENTHLGTFLTLQAAENLDNSYWYRHLELLKVHYGHSWGSFYAFPCAKRNYCMKAHHDPNCYMLLKTVLWSKIKTPQKTPRNHHSQKIPPKPTNQPKPSRNMIFIPGEQRYLEDSQWNSPPTLLSTLKLIKREHTHFFLMVKYCTKFSYICCSPLCEFHWLAESHMANWTEQKGDAQENITRSFTRWLHFFPVLQHQTTK